MPQLVLKNFGLLSRFGILTKQRTSLNRIDNYKLMRICIIMVIIVKASTAPTTEVCGKFVPNDTVQSH